MTMPYAFLKALNEEESYINKKGRLPKKQAEFLLKPGNMKGGYLGAYLDSCRWGGETSVMYEMPINGMVSFIQNWMEQNKDNFQNLFHEKKIKELYRRFELPHIDYKVCPKGEEHKGTIEDSIGRVRCANKTIKKLKPSFTTFFEYFDESNKMIRMDYLECTPTHSIPDDAWNDKGDLNPIYKEEYESYNDEMDRFEEEPTFAVTDFCYSIISDKKMILPLETILRRLNLETDFELVYCKQDFMEPCNRLDELDDSSRELYENSEQCPGHKEINEEIAFPFDGWDLAFYVQKWWWQKPKGRSPLFEK